MKIIIAPDSFKGNMRSARVCRVIRETWLRERPNDEVVSIPMADGGEGTVDAVTAATGGSIETVQVSGPLGEPVDAPYGMLPDGTAVAEMAAASGIELLAPDQLDPMKTSTFGTGELLRHLLDKGVTSIVMGIGGSATVDGGVGMAQALGCRFFDAQGHELTRRGGCILSDIASIDCSGRHPALDKVDIRIACDVTNPLCGSHGAAAVFGPQKGATPEMVDALDEGLVRLAAVADVPQRPGDGAAGGLGYGLRAFCGAKILSGAALIAETVGLQDKLCGAKLLITGEGRTDAQTASGKLCAVMAEMAHQQGVPCALMSGALHGPLDPFLETFDYAFSISSGHASLEECIAHASGDLAFLTRNLARLLFAD